MENPLPEPLVSVVMPVFNGLAHLDDSISSVLRQSLTEFELLILDDGSTDGTLERLRVWEKRDERIKVFTSPANLGVVASSNLIVSKAGTTIIARMDADDVSHPDRLSRQREVLHNHADVQLVGTLWHGINADGLPVRPRDRWRLAYPSQLAPFPHGSIMFRLDSFQQVGGYREQCRYWEDLDLYFRLEKLGRVVAIPHALYHYRFHTASTRTITPSGDLIDALVLMRQCRTAHAAGDNYDQLLERRPRRPDGRIPAPILNSITSARLWSGHSPGALGLLMKRGDLGWDRSSAAALTTALWGALSPASLRLFLSSLIRVRDWLATRRVIDRDFVEWRHR